MLPCNVTLHELENGAVVIAIIDPSVAMAAVGNAALKTAAKEVKQKLMTVLNNI
jgi:pyrimidine deaminase RibD-like protein